MNNTSSNILNVILLELNSHEVFNARLVCTKWNNTIKSSNQIWQQMLDKCDIKYSKLKIGSNSVHREKFQCHLNDPIYPMKCMNKRHWKFYMGARCHMPSCHIDKTSNRCCTASHYTKESLILDSSISLSMYKDKLLENYQVEILEEMFSMLYNKSNPYLTIFICKIVSTILKKKTNREKTLAIFCK